MNLSCSRKIARLLAVLICCALLAGCKGNEQEDVFPDIAHYTVPEQNSMRVTLYFPTEEPSAFSSEVRQVDLPSEKRPSEAVIEQLMRGPQGNLLPACPAHYSLNHVWIIDNVAYIDLHNNGEEEDDLSQFCAVAVRTLNPIFNTDYVLLTVDGNVPIGVQNGLERSSEEKETNKIHLLTYYPDKAGEYLVPKPRSSDKQMSLWVSAFSLLVAGNEPEGTKACFDDQIKVISGRIEADTLYVDLFVPESHTSSPLCYAAYAQTLLHNASGLKRVILSANGTPLQGMEGMSQNPGEFTKESLSDLLGAHITAYYANEDGLLTAVRRAVPMEKASNALTPLYEMLKAPEQGETLASVFPSGIQEKDILDINYDHNTAILNLSDHFYEAVGALSDTAETQLVYGMVNALTDHGGISRVVLLQNGQTRDLMNQTVVIAKPLLRNPGMISKQ